ncbi:hypothetical protein PSI9734_02066 [Pseudidiomarina piscicola]|uniref:Uncharacterized protein n=1 Tax=Pseudidiomarina piscicola TaxID=2614830 RepID=A0A6S6WNN2_9GAMM|nr:hypothetical protein [Pseudidiomarina piscicola]CAB0151698.1 hypothetical protein PSI9734_02066 [Pseudidiomarina piscicola]VZT41156.1 hypothetical protein PSI9734_02066 [Pseudomonas aeruginosa]
MVRETSFLTNDDVNIVDAVSAYNTLLNDIYNQWVSIQTADGTFYIYDSDTSFSSGVADAQVQRESLLYRMLRGQALYNVPYPSYSWMISDEANEVAVNRELIILTSLDSLLSVTTNGMKASLSQLLLDLPLQYTVRFENGDTVAFAFNGFFTAMFRPLHETAQDAAGNRLAGSGRTSGGGSYGSGYSGFYSYVDTNGLFMRRICTTAYTGPSGSTEPTPVCYIVYL